MFGQVSEGVAAGAVGVSGAVRGWRGQVPLTKVLTRASLAAADIGQGSMRRIFTSLAVGAAVTLTGCTGNTQSLNPSASTAVISTPIAPAPNPCSLDPHAYGCPGYTPPQTVLTIAECCSYVVQAGCPFMTDEAPSYSYSYNSNGQQVAQQTSPGSVCWQYHQGLISGDQPVPAGY